VEVDIPASFDKGEVEKSFWQMYQPLLEAKDQQINKLLNQNTQLTTYVIETLAEKQQSQTNNFYNSSIHGGVIEMSQDNSQGYTYNQGIGYMSGGEIKDNATVAGVYNEAQRQDLAAAAREIQAILTQLEETYPTETKPQKRQFTNEALARIEQNPALMQRLRKFHTAGTLGAVEKLLDNPAGAFFTKGLEAALEEE
jgi:hypothetical protein